ncbi:MAG: haloacid dehalogenase-like hydrolase [Proteobacteria bacterium]|nr:haloacid dehalogenase-like hydrolase [Pseudomonadota bacterium]
MNLKIRLLTYGALLFFSTTIFANDPLPSWNDGNAKQTIIHFVSTTTQQNSKNYVAENKRIAVFDNDGTLWVEHPIYVQFAFALDRIKVLAPEHPEWKSQQPFKAIIENDVNKLAHLNESEIYQIVMITHAGITSDAFNEIVRNWLKTAQHPRFKVAYTKLVYQPMIELMDYLRANGFKTFIVSGGGVEFMRTFTEQSYDVPPWQVIGSTIKLAYQEQKGKHVLMRLPHMEFIDDKSGKPIAIETDIGIRPIAAFGNSDGDYQMLAWTSEGTGPKLAMIVHHTDAQREYKYDRDTMVGKLDKALDAAKTHGWVLINMKEDWKHIWKD